MLDYDNSAFYYFALTLLSIYLIPGTWYFLTEVFHAFLGSGALGSKARTETEKAKSNKLKAATTGITRLRKSTFLINLAVLVVAWLLFSYLISLVITDGEVNTFDPYVILGIEQGSASGEIKKAYRKLSLKYHPDKNIGSKVAEEMFMKIAKAYEALTDETSKENYEKYGNPDGKQSLEVSIGLPRIILDNPKVVLVLYLVAMVVVIPVSVGLWYSNSKQFGEKNIKYETYNNFYNFLKNGTSVKKLPEIMATAAECTTINQVNEKAEQRKNEEEAQVLKNLITIMKKEKLMPQPELQQFPILKGNLLLHVHMLRFTDQLTPSLRKDLDQMLARAPELIEGMIEICHQRRWLDTTIAAIKFSQCIVQALSEKDSPLKQLPHLGEEEIKSIAKACEGDRSLIEFLHLEDANKPGLDKLPKEKRDEVLATCKLLPCLDIKHELFTEEDDNDFFNDDDDNPGKAGPDPIGVIPTGDQIFEQDLVTLRVTITRRNVTEGDKAPAVLAPYFPKTIQEGWWFILTDKSKKEGMAKRGGDEGVMIHAIEKVADQGKVIKHELRFMAPQQAGTYHMQLHILSDAYKGLDELLEISFTVLPQSELPEYLPHPEDVELDNEPSLFEQVMAANQDIDSESDDDEPTQGSPSRIRQNQEEEDDEEGSEED